MLVGVYRHVGGERRPGAIAVVQVEIDHQHRRGEAAGSQAPDRHGHVVEHAEPHPAGRGSVMEATFEIHGDSSAAQDQSGGLNRPAHAHPLQVEDVRHIVGRYGRAENAR